MEIFKEFTFDAAHYLPKAPEGHKCRSLHGHTYTVRVFVTGAVNDETGWIVDFADIKHAMRPVLALVDHNCLNDIEGLSNPTTEALTVWIWRQLKPSLSGLCRLEVSESSTSGCTYNGPAG